MAMPVGSLLKNIVGRLRSRFAPDAGPAEPEHDFGQDFERELASHLEMLTEENVQRGMAPDEARRAARIRLGGTTQLAETNRELRRSEERRVGKECQ